MLNGRFKFVKKKWFFFNSWMVELYFCIVNTVLLNKLLRIHLQKKKKIPDKIVSGSKKI